MLFLEASFTETQWGDFSDSLVRLLLFFVVVDTQE